MALESRYETNLPEVIQTLRSIEAKANDRLRAINTRGARALLSVARSVVHVKSGHLRDSLFIEGPFDVTSGTFEGRVISTAPYAQYEVAKGGEHDFATRTIQEGQDIIDQVAQDMETMLINLIEAG